MAVHGHLKNDFTEDEKKHNLMRWLVFQWDYLMILSVRTDRFGQIEYTPIRLHLLLQVDTVFWPGSTSFGHVKFNTCTVVPLYNDHLYNGDFDFRWNFIGNGSILIKIYYITTEFTLSDTDSDSRQRIAFFTHFYSLKRQKKIIQ